jgi:predicted small secreted protein
MKGDKMKKLLLVLLVVALAAFLLVGCIPVTPGEGEGEGEGEVTVVIEGAVVIDGKTYVSAGTHDVTVTFPAPVAGWVDGWIDDCEGDYSKSKDIGEHDFVLFPDAAKKVWIGSTIFEAYYNDCCATYIEIWAGECEDEACIWFPVIVDSEPPYALIEVTSDECTCEGCELTFESGVSESECDPDLECCGDDCSGLASWAVAIYEDDPFDVCCETPCDEPISTCSGTICPVLCTTDCLEAGEDYYVVASLVDKVGNEEEYYAIVSLDTACGVTVTEYYADSCDYNDCLCTNWVMQKDTDEFIGNCYSVDDCASCE